MVKKYPMKVQKQNNPELANPSAAVINRLLNYSKSVEVKQMKHEKVLVILN